MQTYCSALGLSASLCAFGLLLSPINRYTRWAVLLPISTGLKSTVGLLLGESQLRL